MKAEIKSREDFNKCYALEIEVDVLDENGNDILTGIISHYNDSSDVIIINNTAFLIGKHRFLAEIPFPYLSTVIIPTN